MSEIDIREFAVSGDGSQGNPYELDEVPVLAGLVRFPASHYVTNTLDLGSNVRVLGDGGLTVVKLRDKGGIFRWVDQKNIEIGCMELGGSADERRISKPLSLIQGFGEDGLYLHDLFLHDGYAYGIGLQDNTRHVHRNVNLCRIRIERTRRDCIDIKNPTRLNENINLSDITCINPGTELNGQAGLDLRGPIQASRITVKGLDRDQDGIRLHSTSDGQVGGRESSITNFHIEGEANEPEHTINGLRLRDSYISVSNGYIEGTKNGVHIDSHGEMVPEHISLFGITVNNAISIAFRDRGSFGSVFTSCHALNTGSVSGMGGDGFRLEGRATRVMASSAVGNAGWGIKVVGDDARLIANSFGGNALGDVKEGP